MSRNVEVKKLIHDIVLTNDRFMSSDGTPTMTMTARAPPHHSAAIVDSRGSGSVLSLGPSVFFVWFYGGTWVGGCCYGGSDESVETQKRAS